MAARSLQDISDQLAVNKATALKTYETKAAPNAKKSRADYLAHTLGHFLGRGQRNRTRMRERLMHLSR